MLGGYSINVNLTSIRGTVEGRCMNRAGIEHLGTYLPAHQAQATESD